MNALADLGSVQAYTQYASANCHSLSPIQIPWPLNFKTFRLSMSLGSHNPIEKFVNILYSFLNSYTLMTMRMLRL